MRRRGRRWLVETYLGISCVPCASDGEPYCIDLKVEQISGERLPWLRVVPNDDPQECGNGDTGGA